MYFKDFPKFLYDFNYTSTDTNKTSVVTDITRNVRFRKELFSAIAYYDEYDIVDGETPEIIAEKIYGNPEYHWIIMLANDKYDYISDFPLAEPQLARHIAEVYGPNANGIKHYIDARGFTVNSDFPGAVPETFSDHERKINESKRRIKIISPQLVNTILKNFKDSL
jgi:hypothetical protein